jgi:Holliday junction DNA helicase RuvA
MDVISNVQIRDLLRAIGSGDVGALMAIKGVGRKKAERIIVELRDLVANMAGERSSSLRALVTVERGQEAPGAVMTNDAISALEVLGFVRRDAETAVGRAMQGVTVFKEVGDVVREALKFV